MYLLIDNIIAKRKKVIKLAAVHSAEAEAEESDEESQKFTSEYVPTACSMLQALQYQFRLSGCCSAICSVGEQICTPKQGDQPESADISGDLRVI